MRILSFLVSSVEFGYKLLKLNVTCSYSQAFYVFFGLNNLFSFLRFFDYMNYSMRCIFWLFCLSFSNGTWRNNSERRTDKHILPQDAAKTIAFKYQSHRLAKGHHNGYLCKTSAFTICMRTVAATDSFQLLLLALKADICFVAVADNTIFEIVWVCWINKNNNNNNICICPSFCVSALIVFSLSRTNINWNESISYVLWLK